MNLHQLYLCLHYLHLPFLLEYIHQLSLSRNLREDHHLYEDHLFIIIYINVVTPVIII